MTSNGSTSSGVNISPLQAHARNPPAKDVNVLAAEFFPHGKRSLSGIAVRAFCLGCALVLGLVGTGLLAYSGSHLWRPCLFLATLSLFHFLEFYTTAAYNTPKAYIASFLLTNGDQYRMAHTMAFIETLVTSYFFPKYQSRIHPPWLIALGVIMIVVGQTVRSTAMIQAGTNFNHTVQSRKSDGHELVTSGLYNYFRHPSYFGFFWWGIGTQVMLGNMTCGIGYAGVLWYFFKKRISHEEKHLIDFFGDDYRAYRARTPASPTSSKHFTANPAKHSTAEFASTSSATVEPASSLLSPPPSPSRERSTQQEDLLMDASLNRSMDKSKYADGPPASGSMRGGQGAAPPSAPASWGLQDARSNLAVQPVANTGSIKLKKASVKMVGAAPVQTRPAAAKPVVSLSSTSGAKIPDGPVSTSSTTSASTPKASTTRASLTLAPEPKIAPVKMNEGGSIHASQAELEGLYARLSSMGPTTPSHKSEGIPSITPGKNMFAFETRLEIASIKGKATEKTTAIMSAEKTSSVESLAEKLLLSENNKKRTQGFVDTERTKKAKTDKPKVVQATVVGDNLAQASKPAVERVSESQEDLEAEYMRKASEYIDTFPVEQKTASHLIQAMSKKLRSLYTEDNKDSIKARFAFALVNYIKNVKKGSEAFSVDSAKSLLEDANGDLLQLCAKLVEGKYISLQTLDDVSGMATALLNILPEADPSITTATAVYKADVTGSPGVKPVTKGSVENNKGWPTPEKRENRESMFSLCNINANKS
ncbi:STE14 protein-S-isoprenylcysteine methyltransferase [Pyrenophora tritici-repentis]|nr:STE14 protein-S-isoprenylcysteine methyltransferase [Pyrenophora tritici-repentis]